MHDSARWGNSGNRKPNFSPNFWRSVCPLEPPVPGTRHPQSPTTCPDRINPIGPLHPVEPPTCLQTVVAGMAIEIMSHTWREIDRGPVHL
jgi:hypothetical protein